MARLPSSRISPTAHYTGHVWFRNGLSHPAFRTTTGQFFYTALAPVNRVSGLIGGPTLEAMLLARHRVIDTELAASIESGEIGQVLEVAAGLSPRGHRFTGRFPDLLYVEADLPEMASHKQTVIEAAGSAGDLHPVISIDALAEDGDRSITAVCERYLDPHRGTAIITEGLISYFDVDAVRGIWRRFAAALSAFPAGLYLTDLHLDEDIAKIRLARLFRRMLNQWTRGAHHTYFEDETAALEALEAAGFTEARAPYASDYSAELRLPPPERTSRVRVAIART